MFAKHLRIFKTRFMQIISLEPYNNPKKDLSRYPHDVGGNWGTQKLGGVPKVAQVTEVRAGAAAPISGPVASILSTSPRYLLGKKS